MTQATYDIPGADNTFFRTWMTAHFEARRGVHVPLSFIDINDGNIYDAILFAQIMYWHMPSTETGKTRLRAKHDGKLWLAKNHKDWYAECRIKAPTIRKCLSRLKARNLIEYELHGFNGEATPFIRVNANAFEKAMQKWMAENVENPPLTGAVASEPLPENDQAPPVLREQGPDTREQGDPDTREQGPDTREQGPDTREQGPCPERTGTLIRENDPNTETTETPESTAEIFSKTPGEVAPPREVSGHPSDAVSPSGDDPASQNRQEEKDDPLLLLPRRENRARSRVEKRENPSRGIGDFFGLLGYVMDVSGTKKSLSEAIIRDLAGRVVIRDPANPALKKELQAPTTLWEEDPLFPIWVKERLEYIQSKSPKKLVSAAQCRDNILAGMRNTDKYSWRGWRSDTKNQLKAPHRNDRKPDLTYGVRIDTLRDYMLDPR